ncbi:hypothetical protein Afil01_27470 [Actinorhabdospora filicis]|uniref:Immunity protein Imm1 n=1 Tax=Actinorhabdospora filicis TaxID=1785913 RepID=A0A9W6SL62_9ACTN|nr:Imm1 family immunity protein [Actinorhabdospora filicis]GLZ77940.1 hypothetical protein Afil01_27470 [Actinorhabdospora filicis]
MTDATDAVEIYLPATDEPLIVAVHDVAALREGLAAYLPKAVHGTPMRVYHLRRPRLPSGFPDHELQVVVDGDRGVGALRYMADGVWFSLGTPPPADVDAVGVLYSYPGDGELPLAEVWKAVEEFTETAERPTVIEWQDDPDDF